MHALAFLESAFPNGDGGEAMAPGDLHRGFFPPRLALVSRRGLEKSYKRALSSGEKPFRPSYFSGPDFPEEKLIFASSSPGGSFRTGT